MIPRRTRGMLYHARRYRVRLAALEQERSDALRSIVASGGEHIDFEVATNTPYLQAIAQLTVDFNNHFVIPAYGDSGIVVPWHFVVVDWMTIGNKIQAIKEARTQTYYSLKETKDIVDNLQNKMAAAGMTSCNPDPTYHLSELQHVNPVYGEWADVLSALELAAGL